MILITQIVMTPELASRKKIIYDNHSRLCDKTASFNKNVFQYWQSIVNEQICQNKYKVLIGPLEMDEVELYVLRYSRLPVTISCAEYTSRGKLIKL